VPSRQLRPEHLGRILIVHRDPAMSRQLRRLLARTGFPISSARNKTTAILRLMRYPIGLMVIEERFWPDRRAIEELALTRGAVVVRVSRDLRATKGLFRFQGE
jgi:hypothetical protein